MKNYCLIVKHIKSLPNHKEYRKKGFDGKEKTLNTHALIRFWKMIKPEHKYFYGLFLCSLLGNLLVVAMPLIMGIGIDDLLSQIRKTGIAVPCLIADRLFSPKQCCFIYPRTYNGSIKRKDHIEGTKRNHKKIQNIADVVF